MLFTFLIVLTQALAIQAGLLQSHEKPADDIEALCADKSLDLTTLEQVEKLSSLVSGSSCSVTVKAAIPELVSLVSEGMDNLCSLESADALKQFYGKYLDTSTDELKAKDQLPGSLRRFALAYGLQMSNLCKRHMVKVLSEYDSSWLAAAGPERLKDVIKDGGPVAKVLGAAGSGSPDEVFLPGDLAPLLRKRGVESKRADDKVYLKTAAGELVKEVQLVCQGRFKPIYAPLMMPLTTLANMGFNYKDKTLKKDLKSESAAKDMGQWARIVFLCEALNTIHIVELNSEEAAAQLLYGSQQVGILTKDEAAALDTTEHESAPVEDLANQPSELVRLEGPVYNKNDSKMVRAVKSFKTSRSEEAVIRKRMMNVGKSLALDQLKSGHIGVILSSAYKGIMHKNELAMSPSEQMVKSLNGMFVPPAKGFGSNRSLEDIIMSTFFGVLLLALVIYAGYAAVTALVAAFSLGG